MKQLGGGASKRFWQLNRAPVVRPEPSPGPYLEPGFRRRLLRFHLPSAFVAFWLLSLAAGFNWQVVGLDARIYYHGSAALLAGGDPWSIGVYSSGRLFSYAGLPPTAILLAPLTVLPEEAFVWLWLALSLSRPWSSFARCGFP